MSEIIFFATRSLLAPQGAPNSQNYVKLTPESHPNVGNTIPKTVHNYCLFPDSCLKKCDRIKDGPQKGTPRVQLCMPSGAGRALEASSRKRSSRGGGRLPESAAFFDAMCVLRCWLRQKREAAYCVCGCTRSRPISTNNAKRADRARLVRLEGHATGVSYIEVRMYTLSSAGYSRQAGRRP